jgi:hypothetical protein
MIKRIKKFITDHIAAIRAHEAAVRAHEQAVQAAYAEMIRLLRDREGELDTITAHLAYLVRVEADKRTRSGHPVL